MRRIRVARIQPFLEADLVVMYGGRCFLEAIIKESSENKAWVSSFVNASVQFSDREFQIKTVQGDPVRSPGP